MLYQLASPGGSISGLRWLKKYRFIRIRQSDPNIVIPNWWANAHAPRRQRFISKLTNMKNITKFRKNLSET